MPARGKHHRPASPTRRLLLGLGVGLLGLALLLSEGTGAMFYQQSSAPTGTITSAQEQLAISGTGAAITLTSASTVGYSPVVTLSNTGSSRSRLVRNAMQPRMNFGQGGTATSGATGSGNKPQSCG